MIGANWIAMTPSAKAKMQRQPDMTAISRRIDETMQPTGFVSGSGQPLKVNRASHERAREMLPELNDNQSHEFEATTHLDSRPGTPYDFVDGGVVLTSFMWPYNVPSLNEPLWLIPPTREQLLADPTLGQAFTDTQYPLYQQTVSPPPTADARPAKKSSKKRRQSLVPIGEHALFDHDQPVQQAAVRAHNARSSAAKAFQSEAAEGMLVNIVKCQVEKQFTMSKKDASELPILEQKQLIDWDLRIVKEMNNQPVTPSSLYIVANDLAPLLNIRHVNVSTYLAARDIAQRRVMRFEGNHHRRSQVVLSFDGAYSFINSCRAAQSGKVWGLLQQHFNSYAAPDALIKTETAQSDQLQ